MDKKMKEIRALTGLSQVKFANKYGIPRRTYENWESGTARCPEYLINLLEFAVKSEYEKNSKI